MALPEEPALKKYTPAWSQLEIRDSWLVRIAPANSDAASLIQAVLPCALVPKVLAHYTIRGHVGIQKLQAKVRVLTNLTISILNPY